MSGRYHKGYLTIPDTEWEVETVKDGRFVKLGKVKVLGRLVEREMDAHKSIKGYEPYDIAKKLAREKFKKQLKIKGKLRSVILHQI